jgi:alpha-1,3-rhamnosyltransferase
LESAKAQTYQNIELIISDDASHDDTVEICKNWLEENRKRFIRTELITVEKNTGIPANCNRGVKISKGEWVKLIAGDDVLINSNIENNINYINRVRDCKIVTSKSIRFTKEDNIINYFNTIPFDVSHKFYNIGCSAEDQFNILKYSNKGNSPTLFIKKNILIEVGYFDEEFKNIEDYPIWLKLTKNNYKIYFFDKVTVFYRSHNMNIYQNTNSYLYNYFYFDIISIKLKYCKENYSNLYLFYIQYELVVRKIFKAFKLNKPNLICKIIDRIFTLKFLCKCIKY